MFWEALSRTRSRSRARVSSSADVKKHLTWMAVFACMVEPMLSVVFVHFLIFKEFIISELENCI